MIIAILALVSFHRIDVFKVNAQKLNAAVLSGNRETALAEVRKWTEPANAAFKEAVPYLKDRNKVSCMELEEVYPPLKQLGYRDAIAWKSPLFPIDANRIVENLMGRKSSAVTQCLQWMQDVGAFFSNDIEKDPVGSAEVLCDLMLGGFPKYIPGDSAPVPFLLPKPARSPRRSFEDDWTILGKCFKDDTEAAEYSGALFDYAFLRKGPWHRFDPKAISIGAQCTLGVDLLFVKSTWNGKSSDARRIVLWDRSKRDSPIKVKFFPADYHN